MAVKVLIKTKIKCKKCGGFYLFERKNDLVFPEYLICEKCRDIVNHYDFADWKEKGLIEIGEENQKSLF